ncbi:hypothetical protein [Robertkochia solimangrovi]|uniref:hypothetical protein n=1 Tax=Robertkochia solimangrovi TaxID=2213046 RepID=UPI00117DDE8C|nr:hypothetical protein [Robertkochia solimangrovi]TRZ46225.1 hypothetical protein DMZ48_02925 [Robertkochia solimangrovi]
MKKAIILAVLSIVTFSCSSVKKTQVALNSGNYEQAINIALDKLRDNKAKKGNQPYVLMLEDAYSKANSRDLERITFLKKDANPANLEEVYQTYLKINERQERVRPLLPLEVYDQSRLADIRIQDLSDKIINSKDQLSAYLYDNSARLMKEARSKQDFRAAYNDLSYLNEISPNYRNVYEMMETALMNGVDFVKVSISNTSDKVLPKRLEEELLNFNTYGIDNLWTVYHTVPQENINYDYQMDLSFKEINIGPEQVQEKIVIKEKEVKDGQKYVLDANGNVAKDSLGNDIKVDNFVKVQTKFQQFTQQKAVEVVGKITVTDLHSHQLVNGYPLASSWMFQHYYARHDGDKRALTDSDLVMLNAGVVPFPSSEEMIYNAGEDIKNQLKNIISNQAYN